MSTTCVSTVGQLLHKHTVNKWTSHSRRFSHVCLLQAVKSIAVIAPFVSFLAKKMKDPSWLWARNQTEQWEWMRNEWGITGTKGEKNNKTNKERKKQNGRLLSLFQCVSFCDGFSEEQLSVSRRLPTASHSLTRRQTHTSRMKWRHSAADVVLWGERKTKGPKRFLFSHHTESEDRPASEAKLNDPHI